MTERLYYRDSYLCRFEATVTAVESTGEGRSRIRLDRSCFYPESGGQMADRGLLAGVEVLDVLEEAQEVIHLVAGRPELAPGMRVQGEVDARRRADHRQQHTGQHLLSRTIEDMLGLATVSSRLGESGNTLDLEVEDLDFETLDRLEDAANAVVQEARPVHVRFCDPNDASSIDRGKLPAGQSELRVIEIEGFDRNACGGTHCANTAEIGLIAITAREKVRGGIRLHFLCGRRAQHYRRSRDRLVGRLGRLLTTGEGELEAVVEGLREEAKSNAKQAAEMAAQLAALSARSWLAEAEERQLEGQSLRVLARILPPSLAGALSEVANALREQDDLLLLLAAPQDARTRVLLARGEGLPQLHCGKLLSQALKALGGKGGGQAQRAQGSFEGPAAEGLLQLRQELGVG
jgi:alanyl-tRNA synthetase